MAQIISSKQSSREGIAIATGYGVLDRDFQRELGRKVPRAKVISMLRMLNGKMKPIEPAKRSLVYIYEEGDHLQTACTIAAKANSGSNVLITLSAADHSAGNSYPTFGQLCVFENETVGYVLSVNRTVSNAHVVTISPQSANQNVQSAAQVNGTISFYGNVNGEASTSVESRVPSVSRINYYMHTARQKYSVTDTAAQNEVEFEYEGQKFLYHKGISDTVDRFEFEEELNQILTPPSDGTLVDSSSNSLPNATGLIPNISLNGMTFEYDNDFTLEDFKEMNVAINDNYGDTEYLLGVGIGFYNTLVSWMTDFSKFTATGISFDYFDGNKDGAKLKFDVATIMIAGVTYHIQQWPVLSHAGSLGAGNMPYRNMAVVIPCGNTRDPKLNESTPYLQLRYLRPQGAKHEIQGDLKVWETGANAKTGATNDQLVREIHMVSTKCLTARNLEKFGIIRKPQ